MIDRLSLTFCIGALLASAALAAILYPFAALPPDKLALARSVQPAEKLGEVDLGDFGRVPVLDLVGYYIENPPAQVGVGPAAGGAARPIRFGGC